MDKIKSFSVLIVVVMLSVFYACQSEGIVDNEYADMPYLSLPSSTDFSNLSQSELEILMNAFNRMECYEDIDGLIVLKPRAGWEVNVSENIYQFFAQVIYYSNKQIISGVTISRSGQINGCEDPVAYQTDCFIKAVIAARPDLGRTDFPEMVRSRFKNGPYIEEAEYILRGLGATKRNTMNSYAPGTYFSNNRCVMIYFEGVDNAHAVNAISVGSNNVWYYDHQRGIDGIVSGNNIWGMYELPQR